MHTAEEATGRIRILKTPAGDAPLEIRGAWVMKYALPCYPYTGYPAGVVKDVVSGRTFELRKRGVLVPQDKGLEVLWRHSPDAVKWWTDRGFPKRRGCFFFTEDEYAILSGVEDAPARVFENLATGRWRQILA